MPSVLTLETPREAASSLEPSVVVDLSAAGLLPEDKTLLTRFVQFISQDALREHVPVRQIVVRAWMRGSVEEERSYHQDLRARLDFWTAQLSEVQRHFVISRLSYQIRREKAVIIA